jgi:hypothetical protein
MKRIILAAVLMALSSAALGQAGVSCCVHQPTTPNEIAAFVAQRAQDALEIAQTNAWQAKQCIGGLDSGPACNFFCASPSNPSIDHQKWCRGGIFLSPKWGGAGPKPGWYQAHEEIEK